MIAYGYYTPSRLSKTDYVEGNRQDEQYGTSNVSVAETILNEMNEVTFDEEEN